MRDKIHINGFGESGWTDSFLVSFLPVSCIHVLVVLPSICIKEIFPKDKRYMKYFSFQVEEKLIIHIFDSNQPMVIIQIIEAF